MGFYRAADDRSNDAVAIIRVCILVECRDDLPTSKIVFLVLKINTPPNDRAATGQSSPPAAHAAHTINT